MRKLLARRPSPAMVVACIALVSSLTAGAVAATLITGADVKNGSLSGKDIKNGTIVRKDIKKNAVNSKKVADGSLLAADFASGQLPAGPKGDKGDKGDSFEEGLASGQTLRGKYALEGRAADASDYLGNSETFAATLPSEPTVHMIMDGETPPAQCPGTWQNPQAAPGHLCVYEGTTHLNRESPNSVFLDTTGEFGFGIELFAEAAGGFNSFGTWAVTAP